MLRERESESGTTASDADTDNSHGGARETQFELETWVDWIQRVTHTLQITS